MFAPSPSGIKYHLKCPSPLGLHHPAGGELSHGDRQHAQKIGKNRTSGLGDMLVNRQTHTQTDRHTDVLITILHHCSCGK